MYAHLKPPVYKTIIENKEDIGNRKLELYAIINQKTCHKIDCFQRQTLRLCDISEIEWKIDKSGQKRYTLRQKNLIVIYSKVNHINKSGIQKVPKAPCDVID